MKSSQCQQYLKTANRKIKIKIIFRKHKSKIIIGNMALKDAIATYKYKDLGERN